MKKYNTVFNSKVIVK